MNVGGILRLTSNQLPWVPWACLSLIISQVVDFPRQDIFLNQWLSWFPFAIRRRFLWKKISFFRSFPMKFKRWKGPLKTFHNVTLSLLRFRSLGGHAKPMWEWGRSVAWRRTEDSWGQVMPRNSSGTYLNSNLETRHLFGGNLHLKKYGIYCLKRQHANNFILSV